MRIGWTSFLGFQSDVHLSWKGKYRHLFPIQEKESGLLEEVLAVGGLVSR